MRFARMAPLLLAVLTSRAFTQAPAPSPNAGPTFKAVTITRNSGGAGGFSMSDGPGGGFRATNVSVGALVARAYPPAIPREIIGLPEWASSERYDVMATSSLSHPATGDRTAMLRAMLADRFNLTVRVETSEQPAYDLVLSRSDGGLGPGIHLSEFDCATRIAAERAAEASGDAGELPPARQVPDRSPAPRCALRVVGDRLDGDTTVANLAMMLRTYTGRNVVDKTGLTGSYRVTMRFDSTSVRRGPGAARPPSAAPSIFTALEEDFGMKLESSRAHVSRLVIDRIERPRED